MIMITETYFSIVSHPTAQGALLSGPSGASCCIVFTAMWTGVSLLKMENEVRSQYLKRHNKYQSLCIRNVLVNHYFWYQKQRTDMNIRDINSDFNSEVDLRNNMPLDDFDGRTPREMFSLLHAPFGEDSPMKIADKIEEGILQKIPMLVLTEIFLKTISDNNSVKLTAAGYLPVKIVRELYEHKIFEEDSIESGIRLLRSEKDVRSVHLVHLVCDLGRLVKKQKGMLSLTGKGQDLLKPQNRTQLLAEILKAYTTRFNWPYNDRFGDHPVGQLGFAFSVELLSKYGGSPSTGKFYAEKYLRAFPMMEDQFRVGGYGTAREKIMECYVHRVFRSFMSRFGLAETTEKESKGSLPERLYVKKTEVLDKVFRFED